MGYEVADTTEQASAVQYCQDMVTQAETATGICRRAVDQYTSAMSDAKAQSDRFQSIRYRYE